MVDGARAVTEVEPGGQRAGEVGLGGIDRLDERAPLGEPAGDGGGERAARAMGVVGLHAGMAEPRDAWLVIFDLGGLGQDVVGVVDVVAALEQHGAAEGARQVLGDELLVARAGDRASREGFGLADVGRDDRGEPEEAPGERRDGVVGDELGARGRHHHGVHHDVGGVPALQAIGDGLDDGRLRDHADLHRCRRDVLEDGVDLGGHELRRRVEHRAHPEGVLRGEGGDGGLGEQAVRRDGLDIRLDARAAAGIGSGDGEHGGYGALLHGSPRFPARAGPVGSGSLRWCPFARGPEEASTILHGAGAPGRGLLRAEIDRGALEHLVDGADGAHLAAHGAGALGRGGRGLVARAGGVRVEGVAPHLLPVEPAAGVAHAVVDVAGARHALGDVGGVRGDLVAMRPSSTSLASGRHRCSAGRHVAQEVGAGARRDGAADGRGDVVVAHADVGHERAEHVVGRAMAEALLHDHVGLDLVDGHVAGALDHHLHSGVPGAAGELAELDHLGRLGGVVGVEEAARAA